MNIKQKLIIAFTTLAYLVIAVAYFSTYASQKALQKSIGENSRVLAVETMDKVDRELAHTIEEFQAYCLEPKLQRIVSESNREFEQMEDLEEFMDSIDARWTSKDSDQDWPFLKNLIDNDLSYDLREKIEFHELNHGYKVLGEIFITNKYGANIALTGKTSDYRQDDELWWQKTKTDGFNINDAGFDESADIYSTNIAIRIEDTDGNFIGVLKVITNIEETIEIIMKTKNLQNYNSVKLKLLAIDGRIIYDTSQENIIFEDAINKEFLKELSGMNGYFIYDPEQQKASRKLLAYAKSQGFKSFNDIGWILIIEHQTSELFAPVKKLRNIIFDTSIILTTLAILIGLFLANHISKPLLKFKNAIDIIDQGNLNVHVDIDSNDEFGRLATSFNKMAAHRKQAEETLKISEGKLNAMLHSLTDHISLIDKEFNITWANDVAKKTYGDDIIGRKCYEVYHGRTSPCEHHKCSACKTFQDGKTHVQDIKVTEPNGHNKFCHITSSVALRDESGNPSAVIEVCRDITEQKKAADILQKNHDELEKQVEERTEELAKTNKNLECEINERKKSEQALRESENRLNVILNSILAGVVVIDTQTHKIVDVNPVAAELIGLPKEKIIGKVCHDFICPAETGQCPITDLNQTIDKSERFLIGAGGKKIPIFKTVTQTKWQGHDYLVESFVDMTARKQAEQALEQLNMDLESTNEELIKKNKELKEFTYVAAHDLKTPLRAIGVLANWISTDYAHMFDEKGQEQFTLLTERVDKMNRLIDRLIEYSDTGQKSRKEKVNLNALLTNITDEIVLTKKINIVVVNNLPTLKCNKTRMRQIFRNLLINAAHYSDKPDKQIKIDCVQEDQFWKFSIADNGSGIDQKYHEKIFMMCQRLSPQDFKEGTGIGLSIVKKIVEDEGGRIWLESEVGKGSTFYFTIPITQVPVAV